MRIKENLKIREMAGEKLVLLERGQQVEFTQVMVLNPTSEWLWNQLFGKSFTTEMVADLLESKYNVDKSVAWKDSQNWIEALKNQAVIEEDDLDN